MNIVYFMTHKTLGAKHARLCLEAFSRQRQRGFWQAMYVYNAHEDELPTAEVISLARGLGINCEIRAVPYDESSEKTLCRDVVNVLGHFAGLGGAQKVLLLKSDYALSRGATEVAMSLPENSVWTMPTLCAKEFVTDEEIAARLEDEPFRAVSTDTYYRGSDMFEPKGEQGQDGLRDTSPEVRFVSHNVKLDFNCHVFSGDALAKMEVKQDRLGISWGGMQDSFARLRDRGVRYVDGQEAFAIHAFHAIDRGDGRKMTTGQRY